MRSTPQPLLSENQSRRFRIPVLPRWVWSLLGGAIGLFDFGVMIALDANMIIGGQDATLLMGLLFFVPYALLGWAVGGLAHARQCADRDHETIARQLQQLEKTQRALVQEEKLAGIGRLAAGVAHEVRNPLGVIRASASMAQESFESHSDPYRALGFVCEETDRLDRLIASLLTFAKPQSIECVPTDIVKVFDRVVELARNVANENAIALEVDVASSLPPLSADPDRLSQAIFGLTLNAIQAISDEAELGVPSSERRILLRARETDELIRLEIFDSGPGVPEALRDEIFEPFVTSKDAGTGLGLPMALRMIEAQSGVLRLGPLGTPSPNGLGGACFSIEFPTTTETAR
jgi:nitrogen-specific signal transduction histidine kinase